MRFVFVILLFLKTTLVFAQNDSSIIVKGHLRAVLQKAQEEDKMILLFPTKKYILTDERYPASEVKLNLNKKWIVVSEVTKIDREYDVDEMLYNFQKMFPKKCIIASIDLTYGEGLLLWNSLSKWIPNFQINKSILFLNNRGEFVLRVDKDVKEKIVLNGQYFEHYVPRSLKKFWLELPDYQALINKRNNLWKTYKQDKTNATVIRELYKLNQYFDVMDCEVKDKYFEIRKAENKDKYFEDEEEFLLYSCDVESKTRDYFLHNMDRSYFGHYWLQKTYDIAVQKKDSLEFEKFLQIKDLCDCSCHPRDFYKAKFAFDTGNKEQLKQNVKRLLDNGFFEPQSGCWSEIKKKNAMFTIENQVNEVAEFYYKSFSEKEELNEALAWVDKVLDLKKSYDLIYTKAKILYRLDRTTEAKEILNSNLKKLPNVQLSVILNFTQALKDIEDGTF